jgi:hypothetical protein
MIDFTGMTVLTVPQILMAAAKSSGRIMEATIAREISPLSPAWGRCIRVAAPSLGGCPSPVNVPTHIASTETEVRHDGT